MDQEKPKQKNSLGVFPEKKKRKIILVIRKYKDKNTEWSETAGKISVTPWKCYLSETVVNNFCCCCGGFHLLLLVSELQEVPPSHGDSQLSQFSSSFQKQALQIPFYPTPQWLVPFQSVFLSLPEGAENWFPQLQCLSSQAVEQINSPCCGGCKHTVVSPTGCSSVGVILVPEKQNNTLLHNV